MNTGGTPDIVVHEETGLLSSTPEALAADVRRLREDDPLRSRLGHAARQRASARFDTPGVVSRIAALYDELIEGRRR
jgi:glycosyltransferase involved in cell wall biosynthesis